VIVAIVVILFFLNRPSTTVTVQAAPSPSPSATLATVSPTPTRTASPTPAPSATPMPSPTQPPASTPSPTQAPVQVAAPTQAPAATATSPAQPPPAATATTPAQPAPPSPTPFAGQVANAGGVGNTRSDLDTAYGAPVGETPEHLVVYRKNNFEFHVGFVPDPNGRAALIVELPQQSGQPLPLEQAQPEAHKLLPKDAQPPNQTPEGNNQFAVERYTSQTLAQALPPEAFSANGGSPGQLMIVYAKDAQGRITRWVVGPGNDPNALLNQGR
jgi:hypothetical protein